MAIFTFAIFKFMLASIALLTMAIDFARHHELKYIFLAYFFLVLGAASLALSDFIDITGLEVTFHFFGITMAGLLFAITAHSANRRISSLKKKMRGKFK